MTKNSRIVPHLWFDREAEEAARFYASVFPDSRVSDVARMPADTPSGSADSLSVVEFTVFGQPFVAFSAGPLFKFNPSISFMVNFDPLFFGGTNQKGVATARAKLDEVWAKLILGGQALMPLDKYPFSERFGWVQDRYGLSWQLILTDPDGEPRPPIIPALMFTGANLGKAKEAIDFYLSVFKGAKAGMLVPFGPGQAPDKEGTVMFADFTLEKQWFAANDSAHQHGFGFTEAVSLMVICEDQKEIDYYWKKLSAVPHAEQCGWLKDRYGVSWQVTPRVLSVMMKDPDKTRARRAMEAMLKMKKFDIAGLQRAFGDAKPNATRSKGSQAKRKPAAKK